MATEDTFPFQFLQRLIAETKAPITVTEEDDLVIIATVRNDPESFMSRRSFWLGFVGKMTSNPLCLSFDAVSCTIFQTKQPILPFTWWEYFLQILGKEVPRKEGQPYTVEVTIHEPLFADVFDWIFQKGLIPLLITNEEAQRIFIAHGIRSEKIRGFYAGSSRVVVQPEDISNVVMIAGSLALMEML